MTRRLPKLRERDLQRQILDWLLVHHVFHYRNNVGAMPKKEAKR
jgi:hypothetical protein